MTKITTSIGVSALLSSAFAFAPPSPLQAFHGSDVAEHRHFCLQYSSAYHGTIGGRRHIVLCNAKNPKKRKKQDDSHDSWYDDVDENASPEDVSV
mmetsp:Transcript_9314/g.17222  ORF Transcript_9314/g.17222 Transcript_9314/m.17222 type:complete len:95 (+) Transcript_9314:76-360(+)